MLSRVMLSLAMLHGGNAYEEEEEDDNEEEEEDDEEGEEEEGGISPFVWWELTISRSRGEIVDWRLV